MLFLLLFLFSFVACIPSLYSDIFVTPCFAYLNCDLLKDFCFYIFPHNFHFSFLFLFLVWFDYLIRYFIALCFLTLCTLHDYFQLLLFIYFWMLYMITAWLDIFAVLCLIILYYSMHFAWLIFSFLAFGFYFNFNVFVHNLHILINLFWSMFVLLYF